MHRTRREVASGAATYRQHQNYRQRKVGVDGILKDMSGSTPKGELAPFFDRDGALITMPRKQSRKIALLEWLVTQLPAGARLSEVEMNAALRPIFDDVAVLRRYLVDFGFVERPEAGVYVIPAASDPATP